MTERDKWEFLNRRAAIDAGISFPQYAVDEAIAAERERCRSIAMRPIGLKSNQPDSETVHLLLKHIKETEEKIRSGE